MTGGYDWIADEAVGRGASCFLLVREGRDILFPVSQRRRVTACFLLVRGWEGIPISGPTLLRPTDTWDSRDVVTDVQEAPPTARPFPVPPRKMK